MNRISTHGFRRRDVLAMAVSALALAAAGTGLARAQAAAKIVNVVFRSEPAMLACGVDTTDVTQTVSGGKILQSLIRYGENGTLEGELAESWVVSDDGLDYTFNLRSGVTWHDGKPFTADDVMFSFQTLLPETHNRTRAILERVASMEKDGDHVVRLKLKGPFLPFLVAINSINAPILPRHLYEGTNFRENPVNNAPIGTGPFKFNEWKRGEFIHLVKNDAYYGAGQPEIEQIYFHIIPDTAQRGIAMETGRGDIAIRGTLTPQDVTRLVGTGQFEVLKGAYDGLGAVVHFFINHRRAPFDDVRVRKALLHAIDRQFIIDALFAGQGKVPLGPIASSTRYFDADAVVRYDFSPDKAKALLDEAGLVAGADGMRASFTIMVPSGGADRERLMEVVRQNLADVGIDLLLDYVELATATKRDATWDYDLEFTSIGQFYDPAIGVARNYLTDRIINAYQNNTGGYSNPEVDRLWAEAMAATSESAAQANYSQIQRLITEDAAYVWLMESEDILLVRSTIENLNQGPLSSYYSWAEATLA